MSDHQERMIPDQAGILQVRVQALRDTMGTDTEDPLARLRNKAANYLESLARLAEAVTPEDRRWAHGHREDCLKDLQSELGHRATLRDIDAAIEDVLPLEPGLRDFIQRDLDARKDKR